MSGQVAYHLLAQAHATRAPAVITTAVSCLPVLVLGMGAALAHLLHTDIHTRSQADPGPGLAPDRPDHGDAHEAQPAGAVPPGRLAEAATAAERLTTAGQHISRRALRTAGLRGSNADLGARPVAPPARPSGTLIILMPRCCNRTITKVEGRTRRRGSLRVGGPDPSSRRESRCGRRGAGWQDERQHGRQCLDRGEDNG